MAEGLTAPGSPYTRRPPLEEAFLIHSF